MSRIGGLRGYARVHGVPAAGRRVWRHMRYHLAPRAWYLPRHVWYPRIRDELALREGRRWDREYGVDTETVIVGEAYREIIGGRDVVTNHPYVATGVAYFRSMLRRVEVEPGDYTFIDIGCGKGRALMLAAELGYRNLIGVELSPEIAEIGRANVARFLAARPDISGATIEIQSVDALQYEFPAGSLVVYLYNPFGGEILEQVLRRLVQSYDAAPRDVRLLYRYPIHAEHVRAIERLELLRAGERYHVYCVKPAGDVR